MDIAIFETPIGNMLAKADKQGLRSLEFTDEKALIRSSSPLILRLECELREYFDRKRREFSIPIAPIGTPFQMSVWQILMQIPYGKIVSYAKEAQMLGRPSAVRAIANANGKNPIAILVPCHRVITSNSSIGGYSGGAWRKEFLLALEGGLALA